MSDRSGQPTAFEVAVIGFDPAGLAAGFRLRNAAHLDIESAESYARRRLNNELLDVLIRPAAKSLAAAASEISNVDLLFSLSRFMGFGQVGLRNGTGFPPGRRRTTWSVGRTSAAQASQAIACVPVASSWVSSSSTVRSVLMCSSSRPSVLVGALPEADATPLSRRRC